MASPAGSSSSTTLTPSDQSTLLADLRRFCVERGISTNRVLALTVQRNRSTEFSSIIVNLNSGKILDVYPERDACSTYKEGSIGNYLYCYNDHLKVRSDEDQLVQGMSEMKMNDPPTAPFCCSNMQPYKDRYLDCESMFTDFRLHRGSRSDKCITAIVRHRQGSRRA